TPLRQRRRLTQVILAALKRGALALDIGAPSGKLLPAPPGLPPASGQACLGSGRTRQELKVCPRGVTVVKGRASSPCYVVGALGCVTSRGWGAASRSAYFLSRAASHSPSRLVITTYSRAARVP